jgi:hypothetical protein
MTQVTFSNNESWNSRDSSKPAVCVKCSSNLGKIIRMHVKMNGVSIPYGSDSAQLGDLYVCPVCHSEIVHGFSKVLDKSISNQVLDSDYAILKGVKDTLY